MSGKFPNILNNSFFCLRSCLLLLRSKYDAFIYIQHCQCFVYTFKCMKVHFFQCVAQLCYRFLKIKSLNSKHQPSSIILINLGVKNSADARSDEQDVKQIVCVSPKTDLFSSDVWVGQGVSIMEHLLIFIKALGLFLADRLIKTFQY